MVRVGVRVLEGVMDGVLVEGDGLDIVLVIVLVVESMVIRVISMELGFKVAAMMFLHAVLFLTAVILDFRLEQRHVVMLL